MSRLLRIRAQDQLFSSSGSHQRNTFDPHSGLQYSEVTCHAGSMRADWVWKATGSSLELKRFKSNGPGCSSLIEMAIRSTLMNLVSLTPECLETVPWQVGEILWNKICVHQLDSLHVWKVFAIAYAGEEGENSLRQWQKVVSQPNMALPSYIKPITSTSFQWITNLNLAHVTCSRHELIHLSKLTNLGTLTIGKDVEAPETGLDDGIVRAWARSATDNGAFSMLRVLACRSQKLITQNIFNHLNSFALLSIMLVENCSIGRQDWAVAHALGWKCRRGKYVGEFLFSSGTPKASWNMVLNASFDHGSHFGVETLTEVGVNAINRLPRLHFSLGQAPVYANVDGTETPSLQCFQRETRGGLATANQILSKRPSHEIEHSHLPGTKRVMRASKQKTFDDVLMEFDG